MLKPEPDLDIPNILNLSDRNSWRTMKSPRDCRDGRTGDVFLAAPTLNGMDSGTKTPVRTLAAPHRENAYSLSAAASLAMLACSTRSVANRSA